MKPHRLRRFTKKPHIYRDVGGWSVLIGHWIHHDGTFEQACRYAKQRYAAKGDRPL